MTRSNFGPVELGAALWGLAEATLFFIVPDVWLTAAAISQPRRALIACLFATAGALVGGAIMYTWGATSPVAAISIVERVPAIDASMVAAVDDAVGEHGAAALFSGVINGRPYKLFAVIAGAQHTGPAAFLLVSVPARLLRFVVLTGATILAARATRRWLSRRQQRAILLAGWACFYIVYFMAMPN